MSEKDAQSIIDLLKALWQLLVSIFQWLQTVPEAIGNGLAGLKTEISFGFLFVVIAVVVMTLIHAFITRPRP